MIKKVRVIVETEVEIDINIPQMLNGKTEEEFLDEFSAYFWDVDSMDDIFKYAAEMTVEHGSGNYDGIGEVEFKHIASSNPNVKYIELFKDCEVEIINE